MIDLILSKLDKVQPKGRDSYMACCPAHDDRTPSLALSELQDGRILIKCFAGCAAHEVMTSIGLTMTDLFPGGGLGNFKGWQQLLDQQDKAKAQKKNAALSYERTVLAIADSDRKAGNRLSPKDLVREQQAYRLTRAAG